jgi:predicted ribosomally synthesized peptide with SipW-like signal peptide
MDKKNTVLLTVIAVATLLVAVVGATFAYFSAQVTNNNQTTTTLKAAELGIVFTGTNEITATSIEPGWSATKEFTVENTSDYDMFFDINFTNTTNTFVNTNDLTYAMTAVYTDDDHSADTVKMVDKNATSVSNADKSTFAVEKTALPAPEGTSTDNIQIVRVFIPANSTEKFTMTVEYAYTDEDQNDDQGKEFSTTIGITSLGIDSSSVTK